MHDSPDRHTARWLTLAGLSAAAFAAQGSEPAAATSGVMTFPNVQVVASPVLAATPAPAAQGRMRAFIDPATGKLVQPTAEQAAELEAASQARPAVASRLRSLAPETTAIYPAQGGVGMTLDESQMSYFVARKDANGKVASACIPGSELGRWSSKKSAAGHAHKHAITGAQK